MKLSIIVPVFDEAGNLPSLIRRLAEFPCPLEREVVFVDDGSQDDSHLVLQGLSGTLSCHIIRLDLNRGKGAAIRAGLEASTGDLVMFQDADLEYHPDDIPALLEPLIANRADVVYGTRFRQPCPACPRVRFLANRALTWGSNLLSGLQLSDMETGYKVFRADLIRSMNLTSRRFGIEVELTACVARTTARLTEVDISYRPRTFQQGKKIGWGDGVAALYHLIHFNLFRSTARSFQGLPPSYRIGPASALARQAHDCRRS